jgi:1,2-diacylglycerol-3-alpha-glucose alpha-1,2-glucosyltransferase
MEVLLCTGEEKYLSKSGVGRAIKHQMKALEEVGVNYTLDMTDNFDIMHVNFYDLKTIRLVKKAKKMGKKIVYHAHSTEEDFKNSFIFSNQIAPLFKKWLIMCYRLGDTIITPTPYSKSVLDKYGIGRPIYAVSNGIEIEFFKRNEKLGKEFRKAYGFSKDDKVIVSVGLLIERKGIFDFIELARRMPEYKFIWFGETPSYLMTPEVRDAIKKKPDNVMFPGYVKREIISGAFSGSDLFIFPTFEENEGIVLLEALSQKQKSIVRDIPVFDSWLEDGKNIYKARNIDEFEIKIKDIINGKLPDLTKEGYKVAKERDLKYIGEQLKEIYEKTLDSKE